MLLLCVKNPTKAFFQDEKNEAPGPFKELVVGNYYDAINALEFDDGVYYFLDGFPVAECFHHSLFAIPSDIDEAELVTKEFNEKYLVPVK